MRWFGSRTPKITSMPREWHYLLMRAPRPHANAPLELDAPRLQESDIQYLAGLGTNQPEDVFPAIMIQVACPTEKEAIRAIRELASALGIGLHEEQGWDCQDLVDATAAAPWCPSVKPFHRLIPVPNEPEEASDPLETAEPLSLPECAAMENCQHTLAECNEKCPDRTTFEDHLRKAGDPEPKPAISN